MKHGIHTDQPGTKTPSTGRPHGLSRQSYGPTRQRLTWSNTASTRTISDLHDNDTEKHGSLTDQTLYTPDRK
ncbi:hypothetical protein DPMN_025914 [Dreissena polymorpha]|uniref:Uncharacterized protein n=1 Tax=Dreissena polymorpha TaxID=45954 RepID=A0A9D4LSE9_DREPO|nr:hypothetical protein DPMN_025914 [Dreissena polymorpha]